MLLAPVPGSVAHHSTAAPGGALEGHKGFFSSTALFHLRKFHFPWPFGFLLQALPLYRQVPSPCKFPFASFAFSFPFASLLAGTIRWRLLVLACFCSAGVHCLGLRRLPVLPSRSPLVPSWLPGPRSQALFCFQLLLCCLQFRPEVRPRFPFAWDQFQKIALLPRPLGHEQFDALEPLHCHVQAPHAVVLTDAVYDRRQGAQLADIPQPRCCLWKPRQEDLCEVAPRDRWQALSLRVLGRSPAQPDGSLQDLLKLQEGEIRQTPRSLLVKPVDLLCACGQGGQLKKRVRSIWWLAARARLLFVLVLFLLWGLLLLQLQSQGRCSHIRRAPLCNLFLKPLSIVLVFLAASFSLFRLFLLGLVLHFSSIRFPSSAGQGGSQPPNSWPASFHFAPAPRLSSTSPRDLPRAWLWRPRSLQQLCNQILLVLGEPRKGEGWVSRQHPEHVYV